MGKGKLCRVQRPVAGEEAVGIALIASHHPGSGGYDMVLDSVRSRFLWRMTSARG